MRGWVTTGATKVHVLVSNCNEGYEGSNEGSCVDK